MNKRIAVFGAAGAIGTATAHALHDQGDTVYAYTRMHHEKQRAAFATRGIFTDRALDVDVREQVESLAAHLAHERVMLDGIVYSVGHCPPGGIVEYHTPLSHVPLSRIRDELAAHVWGVVNIYQCLLPLVRDGGCFVFISSAITRNRSTDMPQGLHADSYIGAQGAKDRLVNGMRRDPVVMARGIRVQRIAPRSVKTGFHEGAVEAPEVELPVEQVVAAILWAIGNPGVVDEMMTEIEAY